METVETKETSQQSAKGRIKLPILGEPSADIDVDAELKKFEIEQMAALGLEPGKELWRDDKPTT